MVTISLDQISANIDPLFPKAFGIPLSIHTDLLRFVRTPTALAGAVALPSLSGEPRKLSGGDGVKMILQIKQQPK